MNPLLERLNNGEVLVSDGAIGTLLFQYGLTPGDCPESVNINNPDQLYTIAKLYLEVGADIIQTNTLGGSPVKLADYGLEDRTVEINQTAVSSVRKAVGNQAYVLGSVGPSGKILQPYGDFDPEEIYQSYIRQITVLIESGVDIICVETMTDLQEASLAVKAAKSINAHIPVMATMTYDDLPQGFYTIMGISIKAAVDGLSQAGADIIGSNCGNGLVKMIEIARELKSMTTKPVLIQSNAGLPKTIDGQLTYHETADFFAENVPALVETGVEIIGGCCGTTPEHIKAIRHIVDNLRN